MHIVSIPGAVSTWPGVNGTCVLLFVTAGVLEMTGCESTIRFSGHTLDKATKAKVILENYYSNLVTQHLERKQR